MAPWVRSTPGIAWQKIDIKSWDSAAARQANAEFKLESIPYTRIYDKAGKFVGHVSGSQIREIQALVGQAQ